jgi:hypothetical protein
LREDRLDIGYIAHPSFVTLEELSFITEPLSIEAAGKMSQNRAYILKIYSQLNRYLQDHDREECGV